MVWWPLNCIVGFAAAGNAAPQEYYDDVPDAALATPVEVTIGPATPPVGALLGPDPSLGGTVFGVRDELLAGATVTVRRTPAHRHYGHHEPTAAISVPRLADGHYPLPSAPPGMRPSTTTTPRMSPAPVADDRQARSVVRDRCPPSAQHRTLPVDDNTDAYEGLRADDRRARQRHRCRR